MAQPPPPTPPPSPPETGPPASTSGDESLIPFVTQAFNNLFNRITELTQEVSTLKDTIIQIDQLVKGRLETIEPQFQELLSNLREQRRSSVTHYSQLAATIAQGFESLGDLRSSSADAQTLELLSETLQAAQDALYCLRMERLIRRYLALQKNNPSPATKSKK
jgi:tRNA U34 5-carboxymethylaminomethyl modifying GTPase MnmE/TrmE